MKEKLYLKIYKSFKDRILCAELKAGTKLPSKRVTADLFGCSVITVENAYRCLCDEGYVYSKERSGYFVSEIDLLNSSNVNVVKPLVMLKEDDDIPYSQFEYSVWLKTIRKVVAEKGEKLFVKSPNMGCHSLRNAISEYLLRYRGMYALPERIVIGSGSEHLYQLVVRLLGNDKIYGIEDPSYKQIEAVYSGMGSEVHKLKMSVDGIESKQLNDKFDVLHVTPFRSYPSDITASAQKRNEYINWAYKNNGFIVEDDFNSEFFIPGNPIESLFSLDKNDSVIYINTFSKSISPSIRIGYMIIPERLIDYYKEKMSIYSCTVPVLDQYVLADFISSGNFERHLNRVRRKMKDL